MSCVLSTLGCSKVVYRVALAILRQNEAALLAADLEGVMNLLRAERLEAAIDTPSLMVAAYKLQLKRRHIDAYAVFDEEGGGGPTFGTPAPAAQLPPPPAAALPPQG